MERNKTMFWNNKAKKRKSMTAAPDESASPASEESAPQPVAKEEPMVPTLSPKARRPLIGVASTLSLASLGWTTWSLMDLLGVGAIGLTVAVTADLIWSSVIYCEYKGIGGRWVKVLGWLAVLVVGGFIVVHGLSKDNIAMAVAGPFLTIGTKAVWELALLSLHDPISDKKKKAQQEIDLLNTETDIILEKAGAEIRKESAEHEADHKKALAEKRRKHELKMAELTYQAEEKRAASEHRSELLASNIENSQFERLMGVIERQHSGQTIQGETVPPVTPGAAPKSLTPPPSRPAPALETPRNEVHINVDGLTDAQKRLKLLAAAWYMAEADAQTKGQLLSQAEFARRMEVEKAQVSRALKKFPPESMTQEDYDEAASA